MPKQKTNKSAAKRFKVTKKGKIMRRMASHGHLLAHKSRKRKRKYRKDRQLKPMDAMRLKRLLGLMG